MPALFQSTVLDFIDRPISEVVGTLSLHYADQGFTDQKTDQTESWAADAARLQDTLRLAVATSPHIPGAPSSTRSFTAWQGGVSFAKANDRPFPAWLATFARQAKPRRPVYLVDRQRPPL
jgi:hypothetical protein